MYDMVQNAYTVTLVAALVPLAAGIFWKRANNAGAILSAVFGLVAWLIAAFTAADARRAADAGRPRVLHPGHGPRRYRAAHRAAAASQAPRYSPPGLGYNSRGRFTASSSGAPCSLA